MKTSCSKPLSSILLIPFCTEEIDNIKLIGCHLVNNFFSHCLEINSLMFSKSVEAMTIYVASNNVIDDIGREALKNLFVLYT